MEATIWERAVPNQGVFRKELLAEVVRVSPGAKVVVNARSLVAQDAAGTRVDLTDYYLRYASKEPDDRAETVRQVAAHLTFAAMRFPTDRDSVLKGLLPSVEGRSNKCANDIRKGTIALPKATAPAFRLLGHHICVGLVLSTRTGTYRATPINLRRVGLDFDGAMAVAVGNFRKHCKTEFEKVDRGLFIHKGKNGMAGAAHLLADEINELALRGDPVAVACGDASILIAGSEDMDALAELLRRALLCRECDKQLPVVPLMLVDGSWRPYRPRVGQPLREEVQQLELIGINDGFEQVAAAIEQYAYRWAERTHIHGLLHDDDDEVVPSTLLSLDSPSMVPVTKRVAVVANGSIKTVATWRAFSKVMARQLVNTGLWPTSFVLRRPPTDRELTKMKRLSASARLEEMAPLGL